MKIIKTIADIKELKFGDQYIIEPKGLDYQEPETIIKMADTVNKLQASIEAKFSKPEKKLEKLLSKRSQKS